MRKPAAQPVVAPSKAPVPKKPQKQKFLGSLEEQPTFVADNMEGVTLRDLNFKVHPEFHTKFKLTATASGKTMKTLLEECFDAWVKSREGPKTLDLSKDDFK